MNKTLPATIFVAAMVVACSATQDTYPPHVLCRDAQGCPSDEDLAHVLWTFADRASTMFDPHEALAVYWYPDDTIFWETADRNVIGFTDTPARVFVTSQRVLVHELMHVHLWRTFPESRGDANHEEGDGPWTEATNDAVREVISALEEP